MSWIAVERIFMRVTYRQREMGERRANTQPQKVFQVTEDIAV